jgi:hypothetical protein
MPRSKTQSRQLPLPVLAAISGGSSQTNESRPKSEQPAEPAQLSSWPTMTASEADRAIFESIAANYFKSQAK